MIDTKKLEAFAASARSGLIAEVEARLTAALAPASTARVEAPGAVGELEDAIARHGGGREGRRRIVEEQAYAWFNRIVALRFMDANRCTPTPVVSPEAGRASGQPAVLAAAKRGEFDPDVFTRPAQVERITGLLDGTLTSHDAQGEAYGLILAAHCAFWHRAMPFMFAADGSFTSLLMPGNLLADGSVRATAVETLTVEDCQDVEVIGWLYQFYISERKNEVFAGFKGNKKAGPDEIPAATQLFTPDWIVRYLVQNSVGRLWLLNHPESALGGRMEYYIEPTGEEDFLRIERPEELTVMDPACGSGHMLTYAFDLLYEIYEEEGYAPSEIPELILTHNLRGTEIDGRAGALAAFALMMKARARQRRFLRKHVQPRIRVIEPAEFTPDELDRLASAGGDRRAEEDFWQCFRHADMLGSLIRPDSETLAVAKAQAEDLDPDTLAGANLRERAEQVLCQAEYLAREYAVVVTNPPYMGSKNMSSALSEWLSSEYPLSRSDLMTAFMERAGDFSRASGVWGMINLPSWMFIKSFLRFRVQFLCNMTINSLLHLGRGVFGSDFGSVAFSVTNSIPFAEHKGVYRRLFDAHVEVRSVDTIRKLYLNQEYGRYEVSQDDFLTLPEKSIAYWLSPAMLRVFAEGSPLGEIAAPKQGLATADNSRFLRHWFEVSRDKSCFTAASREEAAASGAKWFPHLKGGAFRKWWGNQEYVINWEHDGKELWDFRPRAVVRNPDSYFKPAISWSLLSSGAPSFRVNGSGAIIGHKGPGIFSSDQWMLVSLLNSSAVESLLKVTSMGLGFEIGHLNQLPISRNSRDDKTRGSCRARISKFESRSWVSAELVEISKSDWNSQETSWGFTHSPLVSRAQFDGPLEDALELWWNDSTRAGRGAQELEEENNRYWACVYGLEDEVPTEVPLNRVSLASNPWFRYAPAKGEERSEAEYRGLFAADAVRDLISYAVGCMFGRYSLDEPGLILASQGETIQDYVARVPEPAFAPDGDNVIPVTQGDWFEDDIVARFRTFLKASFGEANLEENVRCIESVLGKPLRRYFLRDFYKDHCKRYSNRPIYWMFSSRPDGKGVFNALIYLHRYTPATLNTVLNEYLREFQTKLRAEIDQMERSDRSANLKRADKYRKDLLECEDYERDVLYPLATRNLDLDLDDGVLVNYLRFGKALVRIKAIEEKRHDVETWTWPTRPLASEGDLR
ncbi:BREX-1 system adenine-specific DNA-methyltransferase PglX [Propionibacterium acidifaciens]|uniref:BREX-1 system adenine-specific DNA-methyltransferase PglX n=1 Tax=Propionibacterium acidifaciens TaxID=556499 RepID=UPI0028F090AA|nr:BREX-1 system adenine-specific DNA-methyltransferase PglX [Propionibacterium acidifaciens]